MPRLYWVLTGLMTIAWAICLNQLPGLDWSSSGLPAGQNHYRFSKFAALTTVLLLTLQICCGLLKPVGRNRVWHQRLHIGLGCAVLVCALTHYLIFIWGVTLRQQHFPQALVWPFPVKEYYSLALLLGWISLLILLLMAGSGFLRARWPGLMRWLHRSWLVLGCGVVLHSSMIGGEVQTIAGRCFYLAMVFSICCAFVWRHSSTFVHFFQIRIFKPDF